MNIKLLTEQHSEFLSLKGVCTGSSESTLFKMPHCWKSHVMAQKPTFVIGNFNEPSHLKQALTCLQIGLVCSCMELITVDPKDVAKMLVGIIVHKALS